MSVMLPYQEKWIRDVSPFKIMEKSRRIGLSWGMAFEAVRKGWTDAYGSMDTWYLGYTEEAGRDFIRDVEDWLRNVHATVPVVNDPDKDILKQSVCLKSGHTITSLTAAARNPRGKKGYFIIDEAAFHDDLPGLLKAAKASVVWGQGQIAVVSTHFGEESDFCKIIAAAQEGKEKASLHKVTLDDALRQGFYQQICRVNRQEWTEEGEKTWRQELIDFYGDDANEELFCVPASGGGSYISRAAVTRCATLSPDGIVRLDGRNGLLNDPTTRRDIVQAWLEGEVKRHLSKVTSDAFLGSDFARSSDLSVLAVLCKGSGDILINPLVIEMRAVPHEAQLQICKFIAHGVKKIGGGAFDATGNGSYLAEAMNEEYRSIEPVLITTQWYIDTMPKLRAAFDNEKISMPADGDLVDDLMQIKLHGGIPKLAPTRRTTQTGARHGDYAIALALGHSAAINCVGPPVFVTAGKDSRVAVRYERPRF